MKMRWAKWAVVVAWAAGALSAYAAEMQTEGVLVASGHPEYPPFMWQEGDKIVGVGPEIMATAFSKLGVKVEARAIGPWDKVVKDAGDGKIDGVVALFITDERVKFLDYSAPYAQDPVAIFVSKERMFPYSHWNDLIGKKGITTIGDSYGQVFDEFINTKLTVRRLNTVEDNLKELLNGQADYFIYGMHAGLLGSHKAGVVERIAYLKPYAASENFYMAVSKKSPYAKHIPEINKIIAGLAQDGTVAKLTTKYLGYYEQHVLRRVQRLVEDGIDFYGEHGADKMFAEINKSDGRFSRGDLYLFAMDLNGKCLANGAKPELIGTDMLYQADVDGKKFVREFVEVAKTKGEGWVDYKWPYKQTGEVEPKISYVKRVDGKDLFIGCGFYVTK